MLTMYERWDQVRHSQGQNALAAHDLTPLLSNCTAIAARKADPSLTSGLDVIVDLSASRPSWIPAASPRLGTWFFQFGDVEKYGTSSPELFWELYTRNPVSQTALLSTDGAQTRILTRSASATHKTSLHLNRNPIYWKAADIALHAICQADNLGEKYVRQSLPGPAEPSPSREPGAQHLANLVFREFSRVASNRFAALDSRNRSKWYLAIRSRSQSVDFCDPSGYTLLPSPPDRFYADPFLFNYSGKTYLFFEDFRYADNRALISCCELSSDGTLGPVFEILKRPYHLSYPFVFEDGGEIYMIPESRGNRTIELYRATEFPAKWVAEPPLLSDVEAVDATIHKIEGRYWMFTSMSNGLYSTCDDLSLFFADSLRGPWTPHPRNPLVTDVRYARSAGALFSDKGRLIRPSQDCSKAYGYALVFSEIVTLSATEFEQQQICRIEPLLAENHEATHTYTRTGHFEVVDRFLAPKFAVSSKTVIAESKGHL
jgi:hypothetical protein